MISVICVYNNKKILDEWLLKNLKKQNSDFELILLDNSNNKFDSAAKALNYGAKKANGKYLMFVHQDIKFCSSNWLIKAENILDKINNLGIAGVAGISSNNPNQIKNIIFAYEKPIVKYGNKIQTPKVVQTLDECLIIIPKNIMEKYKFDEKTCDNWHFYAVDYCLSIVNFGIKPYVIPLQVHHQSLGFSKKLRPKISSIKYLKDYYRSLNKIMIKHWQNYDWIYTTSGNYKTNSNLVIQDFKRLLSKTLRK